MSGAAPMLALVQSCTDITNHRDGSGRMPREVRLRTDGRIHDDVHLLVRFNDDADVPNALRLALADAHLYRVLPGHAERGALTVSVFLVSGIVEARTLAAGVGQHVFGLATAGRMREAGHEVVATTVYQDGVPAPFSERHADVVVTDYPGDLPAYTTALARPVRREIRERLLPAYEQALRLFDPRYNLSEKA